MSRFEEDIEHKKRENQLILFPLLAIEEGYASNTSKNPYVICVTKTLLKKRNIYQLIVLFLGTLR